MNSLTLEISMRELIRVLIVISLVVTNAGCALKSAESKVPADAELSGLELPMPSIPDSLISREDKLKYVGLHYWDSLDFSDTVRSLDDAFMEQNFSNYTVVTGALPDSVTRREVFGRLLSLASKERPALNKIKKIAMLYLSEPDSPVYDELQWIDFLNAMLSHREYLEGGEEERYNFLLEVAMKNRPGTVAVDFEYVDMKEDKHTLHSTVSGKDGIVVMFYDPDCNHCEEVIERLRQDRQLISDIKDGKLRFLAIAVNEDKGEWLRRAQELPEIWTVGFNTDEIEERDAYWLPSFPSIYVLDKDYRVLKKDAKM